MKAFQKKKGGRNLQGSPFPLHKCFRLKSPRGYIKYKAIIEAHLTDLI
jgi:hypothetical protein